jgi:predicted CXXCH cytochrome family protein
MRLALITVTRNRKGQAIRVMRMLEGDSFAIGRGAQCVIHLPDPRVALEHATIYVSDGVIRLGVVGAATMLVNGRPNPEVVLTPGVAVEIGPYGVEVETPPEGADLALAIELKRPLPDDLAEIRTRSRMTLEATGLSKRRPAWVLAFVVLVLFLAIPVLNALMPSMRVATDKFRVRPDASWNPGTLAAGHAGFGSNCAVCHETPFLRVRDRSCLKCHEKIPGHVLPVSVQVDLFGGTRCASCHADHKGSDGLVRRDAGLCGQCHQDLKRRLPGTELADVGDFATAHPEFRLSVWAGPGDTDTMRVTQSDKARLVENSHLKFPHDAHLKPNIRGRKGRVTLECGSCHTPDAAGRSFEPVNMDKHCLECHTLEFEPAVTKRQVPHGSVDDVMSTMQEFYSSLALKDVAVDTIDTGDIRRSIPQASSGIVSDAQRRRALAWADRKGAVVAQDLFEKRVCIVCHDVSKTTAPGMAPGTFNWSVAELHVPDTWMPKALFDHEKHLTFKCADCHESVMKSKKSGDIALPDIASCISCHGFHETGHPPWNQRAAKSIAGVAHAASVSGRAVSGSAP